MDHIENNPTIMFRDLFTIYRYKLTQLLAPFSRERLSEGFF